MTRVRIEGVRRTTGRAGARFGPGSGLVGYNWWRQDCVREGRAIVESEAPAEKGPKRSGDGLLATGFALNLLYAMYISGLGVLLPALGRTFHLGIEVKGRLFPASFAGAVLGVLVTGSLSDRFGRKPILLLSVLLYTFGLVCCGAASTFGLALLAAPLIGAGSAGMQSVMNAALSDQFPEKRPIVLNTMQVAFGLGAILSPALAQHLLSSGTDWRTLYFALAAAGAAAVVVLLVLPMPHPAPPGRAPGMAALLATVATPFILALCLAQFLYAGAEVGFFSWMPTYFQERLPDGGRWAGLIVSLFWVGMTIGRMSTGWLLRRFALAPLRLTLAGAGAASAALTLLGPTPPPVVACVLATGLCFGGIYSVILAEGSGRFPEAAGTVLGAIAAAGNIGVALFPWAIGALVDAGVDWRKALLLPPLCAAGVALNAGLLLYGRALRGRTESQGAAQQER